MATGKALNGKSHAGNPHARFYDEEVASALTPRRWSPLFKVPCTVMALALTWSLLGEVRINEVQISNDLTLLDEHGGHPDWIELYNDSNVAVDLSGWGLSDNSKPSKLFKWTFPTNTFIKPNGYLTIFADSTESVDVCLPEPLQPNAGELGDDLVAWFTGDKAVESYGDGVHVQQWLDLSGKGNDAYNNSATEASRPIVATNAINGHAALSFNAADKTVLNLNKDAFSGMSDMSNLTIMVVAKWNGTYDTGGTSGIFGIGHNTFSQGQVAMQVLRSPKGRLRTRNGGTTAYATAPSPLEMNRWYSLGMGTDSNREVPRISTYIDQQKVASADCEVSSLQLSEASSMTLGLSRKGSYYFDGQIAEFIMFRRQLTESEYASVYQYLSNKYGLPTHFYFHASFSLSADDDGVMLTPPGESSPTDSLLFEGDFPCDTSIGRDEDGAVVYYAEPTPGAANSEQSFGPPLGSVVMSVERGVYSEPFEVYLSYPDDPTARIYYTLDHQDPSPETGILYDGSSLSVSNTTVLRATAVSDTALPLPYRNITSHTYIFLRDVLSQSKPAVAQDVWSDAGASTKASYSMSSNVVYDSMTESELFASIMACPIVSITMSDHDMFNEVDGLYARPASLKGQEKYASVEWVTGESVFGLGAGVRIQGHTSQKFSLTPKKSFRLCFRGRYGSGKLKYPVLKDGGCDKASFNTLILRGENGNSWPCSNGPRYGTNMRDQFVRDLQGEISGYQSSGTHVGVFINGLYWGLYNICERVDDSSAAEDFGGEKDDYNVLTTGAFVRDGTAAPYKSFVNHVQATDMSIRENYEEAVKELDLKAFIEYMIIKSWSADPDWPHYNWIVVHSPTNNVPYRFYVWDTEGGLKHVYIKLDRLEPSAAQGYSPLCIHNAFLTNSEYRCQFGDAVQRLLFSPNGALSSEGVAARYARKAQKVRPMIFAEAARWGAYRHEAGYQNDIYGLAQWDSVCATITNTFAANRKNYYIDQLKGYGLYPDVDAANPVMVNESNTVARLEIPIGGVAYYTQDGTDPRLPYAEGAVAPTAIQYVADTDISCSTGGVVRVRVLSGGKWSALTEFTLQPNEETPGAGLRKNELLSSANGISWDDDANWSLGTYPDGAGSWAVIGIPSEFKKGKGWRNIHIDENDVTVGTIEVTCGGFTNRIDTGKSGNLTFDGGETNAAVYLRDEANASLLMIDLDAPNVVRLASDTLFVVSNSVGDVQWGGLLCKGVWDGGKTNLVKQGPGLMTIDFQNTPETAFAKIQIGEGEIAILKPIYAESITKDGVCSVRLGSTDVEVAVQSAVRLSNKLSADTVNLFIPTYAGGSTWYGAVVAGSELSGKKKCHVFVLDDLGPRSFGGRRYREISGATIDNKVPTADGCVTYGVMVPVQNATVLIDRQGNERVFDSSMSNDELLALLKSGGKLQVKDAQVSVDDGNHTVTINGVPYSVPDYYGLQLNNGQITKTLNDNARPVFVSANGSTNDAFVITDDKVRLNVQTRIGLHYTIQTSASLSDPVWIDGECVQGDGTVQMLSADKAGTSGFYRVKVGD